MEANAKSANGGFKGGGSRVADGLARDQDSTVTLKDCCAIVESNKKTKKISRAAEKKRKRLEKCQAASTLSLKESQAAVRALSAEKNAQKAAGKKEKKRGEMLKLLQDKKCQEERRVSQEEYYKSKKKWSQVTVHWCSQRRTTLSC